MISVIKDALELYKMRDSIKNYILTSPKIMKFGAFIYNMLTLKLLFVPHRIDISECICRKTHFNVKRGSSVKIGLGSLLKNCKFIIKGKNSKIILGDKCKVRNTTFICEDDNSIIVIGEWFTMEGGDISSTEGGKILIGNNCMFAYGIDIRNGDSHSIYDKVNGKRINVAQNIDIKDHVWLAGNVKVLKGSSIASGCIVGNSSLVTNKLEEQDSIYVGCPAVLKRKGITWSRKR